MIPPSGTEIRRMLAKARETHETSYRQGVEAALAWVLGERKEPPIA